MVDLGAERRKAFERLAQVAGHLVQQARKPRSAAVKPLLQALYLAEGGFSEVDPPSHAQCLFPSRPLRGCFILPIQTPNERRLLSKRACNPDDKKDCNHSEAFEHISPFCHETPNRQV